MESNRNGREGNDEQRVAARSHEKSFSGRNEQTFKKTNTALCERAGVRAQCVGGAGKAQQQGHALNS